MTVEYSNLRYHLVRTLHMTHEGEPRNLDLDRILSKEDFY